MNILIVDDEYYIVQGIAKIISESFTEFDCIYEAYSTEQAKRIIEKESIDILITDIEMPRENGLSLVSWIYSNAYPIICMILSGHQRFDYAQKALKFHCVSYVLKPVDKIQLCDEIRHALDLIQNRPSQKAAASNPSDISIKADPSSTVEDEDFVFRVRTYIYSNLSNPDLNRSSIAEYLHMSPDYLSYVFHQKFNQTLNAYITFMRIDKAKELLKRTSWGMDVIAEKTGFSSSSYFHKQFKKISGITPQQYRSE